MTAAALMADRSGAMDFRDRRDVAWSAIVEALYAAEHWPPRHALIRAGWQAIYDEVRAGRQHHGYRDREWDAGHGSAPRFAAYWSLQVSPSPEVRVVERLTLPTVLAALPEHQRRALVALAARDGDRGLAAADVGVARKTFDQQIRLGRRRCLVLWLEGETPAWTALRRLDRRRHVGAVAACGTPAAARRHRARRETLCPACLVAESAARRERLVAATG
jgi:DNA-directed RNA polymerase specialized sigma24 family protein